MAKRFYNYGIENRQLEFGGFLQFKFDAIDIVSRNINGKPTQIDFYQNGLTEPISKKVMTVNITYDLNGYKKTIEVIDLLTVEETNKRG